jgi:hypothetical protein
MTNMSKIIDNIHNRFRNQSEKLLKGTNMTFNGINLWDIQVDNADLYICYPVQVRFGQGLTKSGRLCYQKKVSLVVMYSILVSS